MFKSGFVTVIGRPNSGKSTLLNSLTGYKIAITSEKAQTTRNNIQGIYNDEDSQIVFIDTPGIHKPQHKLGQYMTNIAMVSIYDVDVVILLVDGSKEIGGGDEFIINKLKTLEEDKKVVLGLNKIDLLSKEQILNRLNQWNELYSFSEIVPLSALEDNNIDTLIKVVKKHLPEGDPFYDKEMITNHSQSFLIKEFIREKVLEYTHEEVPHSVAVTVDLIEEIDNEVNIMCSIIVERDSQKGILIGKQAKMLAKIRTKAYKTIRELYDKKVHLDIHVKVEKNWRDKAKYLEEYGYKESDY